MLKIKVTYWLTPAGLLYFPDWYKTCWEETSKQAGFVNMFVEPDHPPPTVHLYFHDEKTFDAWTETQKHDELAAQIEAYFVKPPDVYQL